MSAARQERIAAETEPLPAAVFDEVHFVRQTFGDPDLQQEIIELFFAQINDAKRTFTSPMTTTAWRFLTHTLKGAASSIGALRIAQLAGTWELSGSPQDPARRQAIVEQFLQEADAFCAETRRYLR